MHISPLLHPNVQKFGLKTISESKNISKYVSSLIKNMQVLHCIMTFANTFTYKTETIVCLAKILKAVCNNKRV